MSFDSFARNAAKALFMLGWVLGILTFVPIFYPVLVYGSGDNIVAGLISGLAAAISAVLVPWIAAAVLWRADKFLEARQ